MRKYKATDGRNINIAMADSKDILRGMIKDYDIADLVIWQLTTDEFPETELQDRKIVGYKLATRDIQWVTNDYN